MLRRLDALGRCWQCGRSYFSTQFREQESSNNDYGKRGSPLGSPPVVHENSVAVKRSYQILGISPSESDVQIRQAFIDLAKKHHPDSTESPDSVKFKSVEEAYRTVMKSRKSDSNASEVEMAETIERDIRHTAPQHRQFLSNEGVGYGTPSQRQRQYQQFRLDRANELAFGYRLEKLASVTEDALVTLDKQATRKSKTQNAIERVVEDLIQESMAKGEFTNLKGMGKPLDSSDHNPYVDSMTNKINKILINNGFVPEWAQLGKEIENLKIALKLQLVAERRNFGESLSELQSAKWDQFLRLQSSAVEEINEKIKKFNFVVPTIQQQLIPIRIDIYGNRVLHGNEWRAPPAEITGAKKSMPPLPSHEAELQAWSLFMKLVTYLKSLLIDKTSLRHFRNSDRV